MTTPAEPTLERDNRGVVAASDETRALLERWYEHVVYHWRAEWAHRDDHPYSRLATFLGERFLTDFDKPRHPLAPTEGGAT